MLPLDQSWADEIWRSPYRLRFELGTGDSYVNMFTSSYDRARQLARAALLSDRPLAIVADFPSPSWSIRAINGNVRPTNITPFALLNAMGVSTEAAEAAWDGYWYPGEECDEEIAPYEHRAVAVTWDEADILIWNNLAQDIGVEPRAPVLSKLVDRTRGIVVNAYDDRGMDVIALTPGPIAGLYRRFDAWLLDYDRPRMAEAFGPRAKGS